MKLKLLLVLVTIIFVLTTISANAYIPASSVEKVSFPVYGVYMTSDPTCMNDLVAVKKLSSTPKDYDFASSPSFGKAKNLKDGVGCIIIVMQSKFSIKWSAGDYTGTTSFGNSTFNDSNCNAGGSLDLDNTSGSLWGCYPGQRNTTVDWPTKVKNDLDKLGMTYPTSCNDANAGNVVPLYISTYSKCRGEFTEDAGIGGGCDWLATNGTSGGLDVNPGEGYRNNTLWKAPTAADDADHGVKLGTVSEGEKKYKFIVNPGIGGDSGNPGDCGILGPPKFDFKEKN